MIQGFSLGTQRKKEERVHATEGEGMWITGVWAVARGQRRRGSKDEILKLGIGNGAKEREQE